MEHLIGASGHVPGATADVDFETKVDAAFAPDSDPFAQGDDLGDAIQASLDALPTAAPEAVELYRQAQMTYEMIRRAHGSLNALTMEAAARFRGVEDVFVACGWEIPS